MSVVSRQPKEKGKDQSLLNYQLAMEKNAEIGRRHELTKQCVNFFQDDTRCSRCFRCFRERAIIEKNRTSGLE